MADKKLTSAEVLTLATEILKWKLPISMTAERLSKMQLVAGAAVTQAHDRLKEPLRLTNIPGVTMKARGTISQIVEFNAYKKGLMK